MKKIILNFFGLIKYWIRFKRRRVNRYLKLKKRLLSYSKVERELAIIDAKTNIKKYEMFFSLESLILFSALLSNFGRYLGKYINLWIKKIAFSDYKKISISSSQLLDIDIASRSLLVFGFLLYIIFMLVTIFLLIDEMKSLNILENE